MRVIIIQTTIGSYCINLEKGTHLSYPIFHNYINYRFDQKPSSQQCSVNPDLVLYAYISDDNHTKLDYVAFGYVVKSHISHFTS